MLSKREQAVANLRKWRVDPISFVKEVLHAEPDFWQREVLMEFTMKQRIALLASKGVGKSTVLAWLILNFLLTRPHPKIAITSISADNLADGLGAELSKWINKSPLLKEYFIVTKTRICSKESPDTWFCSFRSWSKSADSSQQADSMAGLHADYMLFVIDEVGSIPDAVIATAEAALASGIETKLLIAGNPTVVGSGALWRASTNERHLWHVVRINSDPDSPNRSQRVSAQWAREQVEKYGRDNNFVKVNVYGEFPSSSLNTLLGPEEVEAAMNRHLREDQYDFSQKRLGVDVARFGDDSTIIMPRQGLAAFIPVEMKGARTNDIAARVLAAKAKWNSEIEMVDGSGGWGAGLVDALLQAGCNPLEVSFAGKPIDSRYLNKRAEMWFLMAEWIKRGGVLPKDFQLAKELTTVEYTFQNSKFKLEEKSQIKERLGFSTDRSDALALTFAIPDQPARSPFDHLMPSKNNYTSDYEPFARDRLDNT